MQSDFEQRIDAIDWCLFETAYGTADDVPKELKLLFSKDESEAKYASHKLCFGLCFWLT
ncbi:hypothetical protein [Neisseria sp. Ec49-e6-T10]|uniref:hypothetical protein n=1 Tax=Neisseria sp. Ec49-e6-T10 TaxID=3140744 RepID=UPI003EBA41DD